MTIKESSVCGLVQSFPILLILAQKYEKCLKTPLIYEPPKPSPSPEYYEALDALFQNLFGHGYPGNGHHSHDCSHAYGSYGYKERYAYPHNPCYTYSYPSHDYQGHSGVSYGYPGYHGSYSYPSYGLKKVSVYNLSGTHGYKGTYAPTQFYNHNHKYKIVVKKNKIKKRRPHKLQNFLSPVQWKKVIPDIVQASSRVLPIFKTNNDTRKPLINFGNMSPEWKTVEKVTTEANNKNDVNIFEPNKEYATVSPIGPTKITSEAANDVVSFVTKNSTTEPSTTPSVNARSNTMERCEVAGRSGECVLFESCDPYVQLMRRQQGPPSPALTQFLRQAHCGFDGTKPKVCCPIMNQETPQPSDKSTNSNETKPEGKAPLMDRSDFVDSLPDPPVCGISNASFSRVVGGVDAKLGDFPWMAVLGYKKRGFTSWSCGGALVSTKHVLTAAHCIHNQEKSLYVVRLGELDLSREDEGATPVDVLVKKMIKHEQYDSNSISNDIGLLVLQNDVTYNDLIQPICIPRSKEMRANTFERYNPIVAGWGDLEYRGPAATLLQAVQLPVVSNNACQNAYKNFKKQVIDSRVLCAGYTEGGKDACSGDSGGPLMQPMWNTRTMKTYFYQIGVVSFGKKCAEPGFPGVYSRVTHFIPWIEQHTLGSTTAA